MIPTQTSPDLVSLLQQIVRKEMQKVYLSEIGVVTETFSHESDSDSNNYECDVQLRNTGLELKKVPVATQRIGMAAIPNVGDLVILNFLGGNIHGAVIVGRLYNDEDRPPEATGGELVYISPDSSDSGIRRAYFEFPGGNTITLDDDKLTVAMGDTSVEIEKDGDVTISSPSNLVINTEGNFQLNASGDVKIESQGKINLKAAADLKMEGMTATLKAQTSAEVSGAATAKLKGGTTTIAGMTDFSPS